MHLDDIQEWTILNTDPVKSHVLHISGIHFQVSLIHGYNVINEVQYSMPLAQSY